MKKKSLLCAFLAIAALTCLFTGALFTASAAPLPKNDTFGKKVVEQFVQSGYRGDDYTRKTSSEIGVHDMIALNMSPSGGMSFLEFTTDEYKNWESVKYFMFTSTTQRRRQARSAR